ncbi:Holliday junction DNA helicase RuvA [bacterium]|nr:Holliday junction DNA helicase RuvA [bacterium]
MITRLTGILNRVLEEEVRLQAGAVEYQVLVPEIVRRSVQTRVGSEITLHTIEYLEGNPQRGKIVPRLVGFLDEPEIDFFELICTVDGIGVRTALRAMVKPIRDVADIIQRQDAKQLATLPGIGGSTAERVIAKLRKKVTKFALMPARTEESVAATVEPSVLDETFDALVSVGHSEIDARRKLEKVIGTKKKFSSVEDLLFAVYEMENKA